jgi:hypothetical protein
MKLAEIVQLRIRERGENQDSDDSGDTVCSSSKPIHVGDARQSPDQHYEQAEIRHVGISIGERL